MHLQNIDDITGQQATDDALHSFAPGLERHLLQIFKSNPEKLQIIRQIFHFSFFHGGREDQSIPRREDESYNPRCARLAQILVSEANIEHEGLLITSILTPLLPTRFLAETMIADLLKLVPSQLNNMILPLMTFPVLDLNLAIISNYIDLVRHLHLCSRPKDERSALLIYAENILNHIEISAQYERLKLLLSHSIRQQERRCIA